VHSTNVSAGESVASNPQTAGRIVEAEVTTFAPREGRNMTWQTNEARPRASGRRGPIRDGVDAGEVAPKCVFIDESLGLLA
jgi:hypothetical protein